MGGHIQKRGRRWQIDYRDGQGRRHRATFDSRKEADNALTGIKARIGKGDYLAEKFQMPVERFDSFRSIRYDRKRFDDEYMRELSPNMAVAVGLAVRVAEVAK